MTVLGRIYLFIHYVYGVIILIFPRDWDLYGSNSAPRGDNNGDAARSENLNILMFKL